MFAGSQIVKKPGDTYELSGTFSLRGFDKPMTTVVDARRIPAAAAKKANLGDGNWLRVRGEFSVKIADHGIKVPSMTVSKVSPVWTVRVSLFAKEAL